MTKKELANKIASLHGITKSTAEGVVDSVFGMISDAVADGDKVSIAGFGVFDSSVRKARTGRNPHSGESIQIPEKRVPKFSAAKQFKEKVAQ